MQINGSTQILGIFGNPIKHSLSPNMHNSAIQNLNLNFIYLPLPIENPNNIENAVKAIKTFNFRGVNVTVPYKELVIPFLDELNEQAKKIGAVNTIINQNGKLIGDNTDGKGFIRSLSEGLNFDVKDSNVFIIGAGGASRAITVSLIFAGAKKIFVSDIDHQKAENLAKLNENIIAVPYTNIKSYISDSKLIVNTTPCGMENDITPFDLNFITKNNIVYDIVYNRETPLVKYCKNNNIKVMDGLMMLLYQGVLAFEMWTNQKAPVEIMKKTLVDKLNT